MVMRQYHNGIGLYRTYNRVVKTSDSFVHHQHWQHPRQHLANPMSASQHCVSVGLEHESESGGRGLTGGKVFFYKRLKFTMKLTAVSSRHQA